MNEFLLFYQPETFRTINFIFGWRIGNISAVLLFGGLFVVAAAVGLYIARNRSMSKLSVILAAAAVAWCPFFMEFLYSSVKEFNNSQVALGAPEREQIIWRYCRIDKYQNLGGGACGLYPYIEEVRKRVPAGSSLAVLTVIWSPYFSYYLYNDYRLVPLAEAEYVLVYRPVANVEYKEGRLYVPFAESESPQELDGTFEIIASFAPDRVIYKRIES